MTESEALKEFQAQLQSLDPSWESHKNKLLVATQLYRELSSDKPFFNSVDIFEKVKVYVLNEPPF